MGYLLSPSACSCSSRGYEDGNPISLYMALFRPTLRLRSGGISEALKVDSLECTALRRARAPRCSVKVGMDRLSADPRVVRVFVSSTFGDMQTERNELVKRTFPALQKLCESRGVTWGEVDLRWGLTDEQEAEGQVLPICLAEIARCRPYFVGILGERYGWVPDVLEPALIEQEPWLAGRVGRSITELEILRGALNNPVAAKGAFFYLRDPGYISVNAADQFREIPTTEDIARLGPHEAERQAAERRAKLADLKARIRASGLPVNEDYPDPRVLGEAVLADLAAVIDELYPEGSTPDPRDRRAAEQEAFGLPRPKRGLNHASIA